MAAVARRHAAFNLTDQAREMGGGNHGIGADIAIRQTIPASVRPLATTRSLKKRSGHAFRARLQEKQPRGDSLRNHPPLVITNYHQH